VNPQVCFLGARSSLAEQVAQRAAGVRGEWDRTEIWVPTAGAERAIRRAIEKQGNIATVLPRFYQPMEALLRVDGETRLASRAERELACMRALSLLDDSCREALFPDDFDLDDASRMLGFAGVLCDLEDLLAEGALWPGDPRLAEASTDDADRWHALAKVAQATRGFLAGAGLNDPNLLRLRCLEEDTPGPRHLFIAGIPDLPHAASLLAGKWLGNSTSVTVLVWMPDDLPAGFDAWGRPDTEAWNAAVLSIADEQIQVFPNVVAETSAIAEFMMETGNNSGIVVPDSSLIPDLEAAAGLRGVTVFAPGGKSLSLSEAGRVAVLWTDWQAGGSFSILRHLLELPSFPTWLCARIGDSWNYRRILRTIEFLSINCLAADLISASQLLRGSDTDFHREEIDARQAGRELVTALEKCSSIAIPELLKSLFPDAAPDSPASAILNLIDQLENSGLLEETETEAENKTPNPDTLTRRLLRRSLSRERSHTPAPAKATVLHGWLEAPWLDAQAIHIAGCHDAVLPGIKRGHAFLPDATRSELRLTTQATRRARDAYLLQALCGSRAAEAFVCSFSQKDTDGSPALPSSLLLRCTPDALPQRIKKMFAAAAGPDRPRRETMWKWELPAAWQKEAPKKISPTDFSQYLRCPLRYYFGRVLAAEAFDPEPREMDARQFGTLVHDALEFFAIQHPDLESESEIVDCLLDTLSQRALRMFGPKPVGAVLVQLEAIRVRLRAFARLQSEQRSMGWRILAAERKLSADEENPFCIGGLPLSAKIDRIDQHEDGTLRVLDYKTTAIPKKPVETHLGPAGHSAHVLASQVCIDGKNKTWTDLQLPLYRMIAERWYPGCAGIEVAYVALPADPARTALIGLPLDEHMLASARACAHEVAEHVRLGHFWPPQKWPPAWEDPLAAILVNGRPVDCFSQKTIGFLKGRI